MHNLGIYFYFMKSKDIFTYIFSIFKGQQTLTYSL